MRIRGRKNGVVNIGWLRGNVWFCGSGTEYAGEGEECLGRTRGGLSSSCHGREEKKSRSMDRFVRWCGSWSEGARARVLDASEASVIGDDDEWTKRKYKGANN